MFSLIKHDIQMEKPLAATPEDADTIVSAAEAAGTLSVGMNIGMRWNPALSELRRQRPLKAVGAQREERERSP